MTTVDDQTDINNNTDKDSDAISPSKTSPITVPILTPVKVQSPCTSPHQSPSASLDQVSDSEDFKDDFSEEEQQPKSKRPPGAVRRRNERERNRVKHINRTFSVLRQHLPTRKANKKLSKVETLRSAVDYIKHLRQLLSDHDSLTAAISLEHALIAHNQQQRILQQQQQQQQIQQQFQRLPQMPYTSVNVVTNQGVPLISPTGSVNTVNYSPIVSPNYQQDSSWEQNSSATDAELMDLAAESCITDIELW